MNNELGAPLLEMQHISKDYFGNEVLSDINFSLRRGEILGLVGENGAGKSTLMKILFGMDEIHQTGGYGGSIFIEGDEVRFTSPIDALASGIGMVHQEFSLLPDSTATENILLNREPLKHTLASELFGERLNTLNRESMEKIAQGAIDKLGVPLDGKMLVSEMPVGHKQFTEIARELSKEATTEMEEGLRLLVLDEPTAVLSEQEAESLLKAMRTLSSEGIAIIFISHRLQEIIDVCDTIMVMRDGRIIKTVPSEGVNVTDIAHWMVGREVNAAKRNTRTFNYEDSKVVLSIRNLWVDMPGETVRNVNLDVYDGEILGIGGMAGQGEARHSQRSDGSLPAGGRSFFKERSFPQSAAVAFERRRRVRQRGSPGVDCSWTSPRMEYHLHSDADSRQVLKRYLNGLVSWRDQKAIEEETMKYVKQLEIRCVSTRQNARELSGGNQQKVCLAKAFAVTPKLLFVSEPTRGIDIGAKSLVLDALRRYNQESGTTIVMISSELEELRSVCDRIAHRQRREGVRDPPGDE